MFLSGDDSFVCTVGKDICLRLNGSASFQLLLKEARERVARMRDALAKNRAELKSAATLLASATDSAAQASAVESVADVIKFKVGGRARTKKVQGSLLGSLAYLYKLDDKLARQLSDKLGVPLTYNKFTLHKMYGTLQKSFREIFADIPEDERVDTDPFSTSNTKIIVECLEKDEFSLFLYNNLLKKEGGKKDKLLAKLKERYDALSANARSNSVFSQSNKYISHTSEGYVVNRILQYRFRGDLVLDTTVSTNVRVKGKSWDAYKRLVKTPNPLNPSQTMGDLLGLSTTITEPTFQHQIHSRAGLKLNDSGTGPHLLAGQPFHLLTVTVSEPGQYLVDELGFKEGALQVWVDAVQVWKDSRSTSIFGLYAEAAVLNDVIALREKHLGKIVDQLNRSGSRAYTTEQKDYLIAVYNLLKNALREFIISISNNSGYRKPTLEQAAGALSDALSRDNTLSFSGITRVAAKYGSLPKVITEGMKYAEKQKLQVTVNAAGKAFDIAIAPKSSQDLARIEILAICIVLNKTVGFDKEERTTKQHTLVKICK